MKYKYKFDEIVFKSGNKARIIIMEDEKFGMVAQFLMSDIQGGDAQYVFSAIDNVLSGKSEYEELTGNGSRVEIRKDKTQIHELFPSQDEIAEWCEIETIELIKLIKIWVNENRQFEKIHEKHSTFFPDHWSPQEVVDAINEAFYNKQLIPGTKYSYMGELSSGMQIEMYLDSKTGKIISAFPRLNTSDRF